MCVLEAVTHAHCSSSNGCLVLWRPTSVAGGRIVHRRGVGGEVRGAQLVVAFHLGIETLGQGWGGGYQEKSLVVIIAIATGHNVMASCLTGPLLSMAWWLAAASRPDRSRAGLGG